MGQGEIPQSPLQHQQSRKEHLEMTEQETLQP